MFRKYAVENAGLSTIFTKENCDRLVKMKPLTKSLQICGKRLKKGGYVSWTIIFQWFQFNRKNLLSTLRHTKIGKKNTHFFLQRKIKKNLIAFQVFRRIFCMYGARISLDALCLVCLIIPGHEGKNRALPLNSFVQHWFSWKFVIKFI